MQNTSKKTCQNRELKRPKQTLRSTQAHSASSCGQETGKLQTSTLGEHNLSSPSHHMVSPSMQILSCWDDGQWLCHHQWHRELQAVPPLPPQHPKTRQGQGHPDTGHPPAASCIRLAGESHKPYLPEAMQAAGCRKQNVLQVVLAGAELSTQF